MEKETIESFVTEMKSLINSKYNYLTGILDKIGWSIDDLNIHAEKSIHMVNCPINSEHRMPPESLEIHIAKCEKRHGSYPFEPGLCSRSEYERSIRPSEIIHTKNQTLIDPESLQTDATTSNNNATGDKNADQLMQLLAAERDAKRRRIAHKRVHTNRKTYSEILAEVISSQMETLTEKSGGGGAVDDDKPNEITGSGVSRAEFKQDEREYFDVGDDYFDGNPFKRWQTIESEEASLVKRKIRSIELESRSSEYRHREQRLCDGREYRKLSDYSSTHHSGSSGSSRAKRKRSDELSGDDKFSDNVRHKSSSRHLSDRGDRHHRDGHYRSSQDRFGKKSRRDYYDRDSRKYGSTSSDRVSSSIPRKSYNIDESRKSKNKLNRRHSSSASPNSDASS